MWIQFKYEFLPYKCFACRVIGHDQRICESKPEGIADITGKLVPLYGVWMKVENTTMDCFQTTKENENSTKRMTMTESISRLERSVNRMAISGNKVGGSANIERRALEVGHGKITSRHWE